jgi:hypothetical protein
MGLTIFVWARHLTNIADVVILIFPQQRAEHTVRSMSGTCIHEKFEKQPSQSGYQSTTNGRSCGAISSLRSAENRENISVHRSTQCVHRLECCASACSMRHHELMIAFAVLLEPFMRKQLLFNTYNLQLL